MRRIFISLWLCLLVVFGTAQNTLTPDKIWGELFIDVQLSRIFSDSKTFVDCIPKREPQEILNDYKKIKSSPEIKFSLKKFVEENFIIPQEPSSIYQTKSKDVETHINELWKVLKRDSDTITKGSSLLPLPHAYIVPGGRFREIYYWDSYFTMLGLKESGEVEMIENMIKNFAYLINEYEHIPNGNRTYYLSRSQPPFFSLMIELLAGIKGDKVYIDYLSSLEKEYAYWMDSTADTKHVVTMPDGSILNRYYDQLNIPRQESFYEDYNLTKNFYPETAEIMNRNLRSAAESGWDFSSRWFKDGKTLKTIHTTNLIPVDLNCLLYHLEKTIANAYTLNNNKLAAVEYYLSSEKRKKAILKYLWSSKNNWYVDYNIVTKKTSPELTLAGMFPLFFKISNTQNADKAIKVLDEKFVKKGGVVTTLKTTGEQWDAPNGWPPLQWITIMGLENYNKKILAKEVALRWVTLNKKVFSNTGKLMEKYDVIDINKPAGGGEYPSQDGFGWTNGVLLALIKKYDF